MRRSGPTQCSGFSRCFSPLPRHPDRRGSASPRVPRVRAASAKASSESGHEARVKFGLIHRIMTDLLASLGLLSLLTSGSLAPWMTAGIAVGLIAAVFIPERFQDHPRTGNVGALLSVLLLAGQLTRLFLGGDVLELAVEFA